MERQSASTNSSSRLSHDSSSPSAVYFCSQCKKPFSSESSSHRHLRYCGSRKRKRPRSCRACNATKIKCSFETPCTRCKKKNIECVYDGAATDPRRALPTSSRTAPEIVPRPSDTPSVSLAPWSLYADGGNFSSANVPFTDHLAMGYAEHHFTNSDSPPSIDPNAQTFSFNESLTLDGFLAFDYDTSGQLQSLSDVSMTPYYKGDQKSPSWCTWTSTGVSLSVVNENYMVELDSHLLAVLQKERPHAQHNANLVIQAVRSFPTMMLRRNTFPWYIHPHSHLLSKSPKGALPEALSTCMSIAQIFASRTAETKFYLWCAIRAEYRRFINEKHHMPIFELLAAVQACMVYLIMCIIDQSPESESTSLELLMALHTLYMSFKDACVGSTFQSELSSPSLNWEDWILAESQRRLCRLAHLWFLIGCVICIKTGIPCDPSQSYRFLPLPGLKSLWDAPTESAWELEYEATRILHTSGLETLGDLIDAQNSRYSPSNAQNLDKWNAGVDNLGALLNLVSTMV
ncbi:hypothetical protein BU16DRAFT_385713 [Lophium mytilinum]|uniref:Zn(2)-C6 fungal-type domain-containing protein n=1 Tax=Lophium mytilinum TaxID=390894 RepID=A0A6A6QWD6_9PEZI|nr:hypothetical protein BU16DRAFT_385713 [Lophium mytilinum]